MSCWSDGSCSLAMSMTLPYHKPTMMVSSYTQIHRRSFPSTFRLRVSFKALSESCTGVYAVPTFWLHSRDCVPTYADYCLVLFQYSLSGRAFVRSTVANQAITSSSLMWVHFIKRYNHYWSIRTHHHCTYSLPLLVLPKIPSQSKLHPRQRATPATNDAYVECQCNHTSLPNSHHLFRCFFLRHLSTSNICSNDGWWWWRRTRFK